MMMIKIADLKNNLSRHLAAVRRGGEVIVLDRDTPVARIIPFDRRVAAKSAPARDGFWTADRLAQLERRGTLARPHEDSMAAWLNTTRPATLPKGASAVSVLLATRHESTR